MTVTNHNSILLPVEQVRNVFLDTLSERPVVLTAPTGSGKSTQVPRWCAAAGWRTLVVEPRRVACRGLAARVAELEGSQLGTRVGYAVRDDVVMSEDTRVVFATPGIVLRWLADGKAEHYDTVILDEFHERSLDVDLLLALLVDQFAGRLVIMSATLDGDRIAAHVSGTHLKAEGRLFPVAVKYRPGNAFLPDVKGLEERVVAAVKHARALDGDMLVFLPGKGEISSCHQALTRIPDVEVLPIHGGLTLEEQSKVFAPGAGKRVILATNVAETSITVPGIGVVIDSGLVRRTRYHNGRGFLTLSPIALDSAEQRTGRAGRTAPGTGYRLWSREAILTERTPPEIHREALLTLVMGAAACGARVDQLPFLDSPRPYAVDAASEALMRLGALAEPGCLTEQGRKLFQLPLDPPLAALLVAARTRGCLDDMVDLVAALATQRPLFAGSRPPEAEFDLRAAGCDVVTAIRAVREGAPRSHRLNPAALQEARQIRRRLRDLLQLRGRGPDAAHVERRPLAEAALAADSSCAHVPRIRKRQTAWSNGGTEVSLGRDSAVPEDRKDPVLVLESRALGQGARKSTVIITCAMPVPAAWLVAAGVGEPEVLSAAVEDGVAIATVGRTYANMVLERRELVPTGPLARETVKRLFLEGRLFRRLKTLELAAERLARQRLALRLLKAGLLEVPYLDAATLPYPDRVPSLESFVEERLSELGLESGHDLPLLSPDDFCPPALPDDVRNWLERRFPLRLDLGDARYGIDYDLGQREVVLSKQEGQRKEPPSVTMLPAWRNFTIKVKHGSKTWQLR